MAATATMLVALAAVWPGPGRGSAEAVWRNGTTQQEAPAAPKRELSVRERGDVLMVRKHYREAIEVYGEGVGHLPALVGKAGRAYHKLGEFGPAEEHYRKALAWEPGNVETLNNYGVLLYDRGRYSQAQQYFESALKHGPETAAVHCNLGTALFRQGNYEKAAQAYERALSLDPDIVEDGAEAAGPLEIRQPDDAARFHFLLSRAFRELGKEDLAERHLSEARQMGFQERELKDRGRGFFDWLLDLFR